MEPFRRTTVMSPPSAFVVGTSYSFTAAGAATYLHLGRARVFPQQRDRYDPDDFQGQLIDITAVSGNSVTATLRGNPVDGLTRDIKGGYWIIMEAQAGLTYVYSGAEYAAACAAAVANTTIIIPTGADVTITTQPEINGVAHVTVWVQEGATVRLPASSSQFSIIYAHGSLSSTSHALASNASDNALTAVLVGGSGASYAANNYVLLDDARAVLPSGQVARVHSVAVDTLTFKETVGNDFTTANTAKVRKITPITGFRFICDGTIDGALNTHATSRGVRLEYAVDSRIDIRGMASNFTGAAVYKLATYGCDDGVWRVHKSGSSQESASQTWYDSNSTREAVHSTEATGFGPQDIRPCHSHFGDVLVAKSVGRGFKWAGARHCSYNTLHSANNDPADNGVNFTLDSAHNTVAVVQCVGELNYGLAIFGAGALVDHDNHVGLFKGSGNLVDVLFGTGSYNNTIGKFQGRTYTDSGEGNMLDSRYGVPTLAAVDNTAAETTFFSQVLKANSLGASKQYHLRISAPYRNTSGVGDTPIIKIKVGATVIMQDTLPNLASDAAFRILTLDIWFSNFLTAAINQASARVYMSAVVDATVGIGGLGTAPIVDNELRAAVSTWDTTADVTLSVTWQHGAAHVDLELNPSTALAVALAEVV